MRQEQVARIGNSHAVCIDIRLQCGTYFRDQLLALRIRDFGKRMTGGRRPSGEVLDKGLGRGKAHELRYGIDRCIAEARLLGKIGKFFGIAQREWAPRSLRVDPVAFEHLGEGIVSLAVFYCSPNAGSQATCGAEHPAHFLQACNSVGKEL